MDPELVAKRRSTVFQRIQFELTKGDVIQKKLSPGKFPTSSVGILKIVTLLVFLCAIVVFLSYPTCPKTSDWYGWLFPSAVGLGTVVIIIFYAVFTFGLVLKFPSFWFITDIIVCFIFAILVIIISVLNLKECEAQDAIYFVPEPLAIVGSILLVISAAGLYIMFRNKDEITVKGLNNNSAPTSVGARREKIQRATANYIDTEA